MPCEPASGMERVGSGNFYSLNEPAAASVRDSRKTASCQYPRRQAGLRGCEDLQTRTR
jgi:hypothetical protein